MRKAYEIDIKEVEKYYTITEDGMVFSKVRGKWLRPQANSTGYYHYCLTYGMPKSTWIFAHTLVALKYLGKPPADGMEVDHIDRGTVNNHYTNLRWVTHRDNILKSYRDGRTPYWRNKMKESPSAYTKMLMANAKKKAIRYTVGKSSKVYNSIEEAAKELGTYRKMIYNKIKSGKPFRGGYLSEVKDTV